MMDIQLKKLEIIQWLTKLSENSIIDEIWSIKSKYINTEDNEVIQDILDQSEYEIKSGNVKPHEQVMRERKEKYGIK